MRERRQSVTGKLHRSEAALDVQECNAQGISHRDRKVGGRNDGKSRILIVDDDHHISAGVGVRLRAAGYDTLFAGDGAEAFATARRTHPDAIVMDIRMPVMDGLTALGELKTDLETREIPVVMLSASVVDEELALDAGAHFFIRKPFEGCALIEAVETATNEINKRRT